MPRFNVGVPPPIIIDNEKDAQNLLYSFLARPAGWDTRLALDTETTGLDIVRDYPIFWSLSDGINRWFLTVDLLWSGIFNPLFTDPLRWWVFANAKYDLHMLYNIQVPVIAGPCVDIIVMCWLRDENRKERGDLGLKEQTRDYMDFKMKPFKEVFNLKSEKDTARALLNAPQSVTANYASGDAYWTWQLSEEHHAFLNALEFFPGYTALQYYFDVELPFTKTLWRMERRGFMIDLEYLQGLKPELERVIDKAQRDINHWAGRPINTNSPKQLQELLYEDLGLEPIKWTKGGKTGVQQPSTDQETLEAYAELGVPQATSIVAYRQASKLLSTYVEGLSSKIGPDGKLHCTMKQTGTDTGRLATENPSLQNIPVKTEMGKKIRGAFVGSAGEKLLVYDYSQIEMRIMAHSSGDVKMIGAINSGMDLHCYTVSEVMGMPYAYAVGAKILGDVEPEERNEDFRSYAIKKLVKSDPESTPESAKRVVDELWKDEPRVKKLVGMRRDAKAVGFGLIYGIGPKKLGHDLGVSPTEAKGKIEQYFSIFRRVEAHIAEQKRRVHESEDHAVQTILGRFRRLPKITSANRAISSMAERQANNAPIQGSAADICKLAMIVIDRDPYLGGDCLEGGALGTQLLLQVHDELIQTVPDIPELLEEAGRRTRDIMVSPNGLQLKVSLAVEGKTANSWMEAK